MIIVNELLDYTKEWELPHLYLFTGNPIVNARGGIVMGRGAARQIRDFYKDIDIRFAQATGEYIRWVELKKGQYLGWIKVKNHWADNADIDLIKISFNKLKQLVTHFKEQKVACNFHCNYPGIGNGHLTYNDVNNVLLSLNLPDEIILYR